MAFPEAGSRGSTGCFIEQISGLENLRSTYVRQWASGEHLVLENEARFTRDGEEYLWRAEDIFSIAGDQIVEHTQYCTGCWTPEQVARQAAEAPMVSW